jgi:hypothetical protein
LSGELPEKLAGMLELWDDYVEQNGVIVADRLNVPWSNSTDWYDGELKPDG